MKRHPRKTGVDIPSLFAAELSSSSPWRSRTATISAMNGARRSPDGPFRVAQITCRGPATSSS
jgi:hypothetical protein